MVTEITEEEGEKVVSIIAAEIRKKIQTTKIDYKKEIYFDLD